MAAALPPVTDCGCRATSASAPPATGGGCCAIPFVGDPNTQGIVPPDQTKWADGVELLDIVSGPPIQNWRWNPNLKVWQ